MVRYFYKEDSENEMVQCQNVIITGREIMLKFTEEKIFTQEQVQRLFYP